MRNRKYVIILGLIGNQNAHSYKNTLLETESFIDSINKSKGKG